VQKRRSSFYTRNKPSKGRNTPGGNSPKGSSRDRRRKGIYRSRSFRDDIGWRKEKQEAANNPYKEKSEGNGKIEAFSGKGKVTKIFRTHVQSGKQAPEAGQCQRSRPIAQPGRTGLYWEAKLKRVTPEEDQKEKVKDGNSVGRDHGHRAQNGGQQ